MIKSEEVKKYAKKCGADLVGIASMDRFEGAPKQMDPRYIMPEGKVAIVMAFRIFRGCLRGIEEGTDFFSYSSMGYAGINHVYAPMTIWNVCKFIEDEGYEAVPYPNDSSWVNINMVYGDERKKWSVPVSPDKPAPDVFIHFRIAAFAAGLGEIGYSKVFLTPEFGPRQRFAVILTDLPLKPDPIYEGPELCDRCMLCVKDCAGKAISSTETVKIKVAGREIEWGKLNELRCANAFSGGDIKVGKDQFATSNPFNPFLQKQIPMYGYGMAIEGGRGCVRACMIHLEERGILKNVFKDRFRRRKPWRINW